LSSHPIQPASEPPPPLVPREWRLRLDPLLLLATLGLAGCSLVALNGATANDFPSDPDHYVTRQGIYIGVGVVLMYALSRLDYSRLRELRYPVYGVMVGLLVLVLGVAQATRGTKAWIPLPGFQFQPSELGKVLLVVALSAFVVDRMRRMGRDTTARIMLLGLVPTMLVIAEPDLGSALVYVATTLAVLFVAGAPWRHFAALGALFAIALTLVLVVAPMAGVEVLKPYQVDRLTSFLHPSADPGDEGYQQQQALIAMGSGEKTGRGVANATQTSLNFLPEHHTDFLPAVIGETYGFAGCALVLSLYALRIWRGLHILTVA
jgi:rod shape determining protein RodA